MHNNLLIVILLLSHLIINGKTDCGKSEVFQSSKGNLDDYDQHVASKNGIHRKAHRRLLEVPKSRMLDTKKAILKRVHGKSEVFQSSKGNLDCYNQHDTTCQLLNIDTFNEKSPSIMFADTFSGRFGNQLLGYVVLYQLQLQTGIKCYITKETKDFLLKFFTPESVTLSVFNETFCNWKRIHFKPYVGHFAGKVLS